MIFTTPLGLLALLSVPAIVAIHLFRRRFPPRQVAGLFLWQSARQVPQGGGRLDRLPITASLLLECLAALALSLILAGARLSSATVNDLYRPLAPSADERRLLSLSKALTVFWGLAQIGVAFGATRLTDNVVNNALAIASFVTGLLLGLFLLGLWTRVGQRAALTGLLAGIAAVSAVKFLTPIAWPW